MTNKTEGVRRLVENALERIEPPYGEDIIFDVVKVIELDRAMLRRYHDLGRELTPHVVNQMIGRYTKQLTGMATIAQVDLDEPGHIIVSYSKLRRSR
jgi:hypothetical protein